MTSLLIDGVILTLLIVALIWGVVLARRIARLQAVLIEIAPALQAFSDAVEQSERSVAALRSETTRLEKSHVARVADLPAATSKPEATPRNALVRMFFETARSKVNV